MKLTIGMLSLSGTLEKPRVVRVVNDRGANVWLGSTCIVGDAASWRELAAVALEAAAIEEDCAAKRRE